MQIIALINNSRTAHAAYQKFNAIFDFLRHFASRCLHYLSKVEGHPSQIKHVLFLFFICLFVLRYLKIVNNYLNLLEADCFVCLFVCVCVFFFFLILKPKCKFVVQKHAFEINYIKLSIRCPNWVFCPRP